MKICWLMIFGKVFVHAEYNLYVCMYVSIYLSIYLFIYLCLFLSIYLSIYLSWKFSFCLNVNITQQKTPQNSKSSYFRNKLIFHPIYKWMVILWDQPSQLNIIFNLLNLQFTRVNYKMLIKILFKLKLN